MEPKVPIRRAVSHLLGNAIPKNGWLQTFQQLDREGRIDNKTVVRLLVVLCERIEEYEQSGTKNNI